MSQLSIKITGDSHANVTAPPNDLLDIDSININIINDSTKELLKGLFMNISTI
jgi:hypothetical protein